MTNDLKHKNIRYFIGAICAVSLPVIIGIGLFIVPFIAEQDSSCHFRSSNISPICGFYRLLGEGFYLLIMLPIILSFVFVTPLIAAQCTAELKEQNSLEWRDVFMTSIIRSTKANYWTAIIYNILLFLLIAIIVSGASSALGGLIMLLFLAIMIQVILWFCVTLPLAIICAAIFGVIAGAKKAA